jgi:hypothetical protein
MKRKRLGRAWQAAISRMEAEDRAVKALATLPPQDAAVAAVRAAVELARRWEGERREMLLRNDPTPVYLFCAHEQCWLLSVGTACSKDPCWHSCPAAVEVRDHLGGFSADEAAMISYNVAYWACRRAGLR